MSLVPLWFHAMCFEDKALASVSSPTLNCTYILIRILCTIHQYMYTLYIRRVHLYIAHKPPRANISLWPYRDLLSIRLGYERILFSGIDLPPILGRAADRFFTLSFLCPNFNSTKGISSRHTVSIIRPRFTEQTHESNLSKKGSGRGFRRTPALLEVPSFCSMLWPHLCFGNLDICSSLRFHCRFRSLGPTFKAAEEGGVLGEGIVKPSFPARIV